MYQMVGDISLEKDTRKIVQKSLNERTLKAIDEFEDLETRVLLKQVMEEYVCGLPMQHFKSPELRKIIYYLQVIELSSQFNTQMGQYDSKLKKRLTKLLNFGAKLFENPDYNIGGCKDED